MSRSRHRTLPARPWLLGFMTAFVVTTTMSAFAASDAEAPDRPSNPSAHADLSADKPAGAIEDTSTKSAAFETEQKNQEKNRDT